MIRTWTSAAVTSACSAISTTSRGLSSSGCASTSRRSENLGTFSGLGHKAQPRIFWGGGGWPLVTDREPAAPKLDIARTRGAAPGRSCACAPTTVWCECGDSLRPDFTGLLQAVEPALGGGCFRVVGVVFQEVAQGLGAVLVASVGGKRLGHEERDFGRFAVGFGEGLLRSF